MPYKDPEKRREMGRIYWRNYAETEKGKEARRRSRKNWRESHPEAVQRHGREKAARRRLKSPPPVAQQLSRNEISAHSAIAHAIAAGRLTHQPCIECGKRAQAHHHLGYEPEHWMDVVWLCPSHHKRAHMALAGLPATSTK